MAFIKFLLGILFITVPFLPLFALQNSPIFMRNLFPSLVGLGLIVCSLFDILPRNLIMNAIRGSLIGLTVFVLILSNVHELNYYKNAAIIDKNLIQNIANILSKNKNTDFVLFNAKTNYVNSKTKRIDSSVSSDWALLGVLESRHKDIIKFGKSYPVYNNSQIPIKSDDLRDYILLGIDDFGTIFELNHKESKDSIALYHDNIRFGKIVLFEDENGVFTTKN